jgi:hypothetical protein
MSNQLDFRLRYQVRRDSPDGILLDYLRSKETEFPTRQMVLWSLSAYWRPLACQWTGQFSEDRLQAIARLSIGLLQKQIEFLAHTFGLEQELLQTGGFVAREGSMSQSLSAHTEPVQPAPASSNGLDGNNLSHSNPEVPEILWGNPEDDELLDAMFK